MSQIKSIKCTNCAAPLNLLGGGRVESITCAYCKSVLDLNNNYKVLSHFKNTQKLQILPFKIGMRATLKEIDYTIIGAVTYASIKYPLSQWTDFLLFSPLYGYAYLTYEEGHLIYSKRNRTFPNITWSQLTQRTSLSVDGKAYTPFDKYDAKVIYVEGELTWIAKQNDQTSLIDLINPPFGISAEKSKTEIEFYQAEYLDPTMVYQAFKLEPPTKPESFHALQPFNRPILKSLSYIAYWVLFIIAFFVLAITIDGSGQIIKNTSATNQAVTTVDFRVNSNKYLVDLELEASSSKELNNFNLHIHKDNKMLFALTPTSANIFDNQTNKIEKTLHPWEKEAKKVRVSLNLEALGIYRLTIKPIDQSTKATLFVKISENSSRLNYFGWFFLLTTISWLLYKFFKWQHQQRVEEEQGISVENNGIKKTRKIGEIAFLLISIIIILIVVFGN